MTVHEPSQPPEELQPRRLPRGPRDLDNSRHQQLGRRWGMTRSRGTALRSAYRKWHSLRGLAVL